MKLLTTFDGRLSRRGFWLGLLIFVGVGLAISLPFGWFASGLGPTGRLLHFCLSLLFCYPLAALVTKRLHDRGKTPWPRLHILLGAIIASGFINVTKIGFVALQIRSLQVEVPGPTAYAALAACSLVTLVIMFELCFLDGTRGDNRFGADPRQRAALGS